MRLVSCFVLSVALHATALVYPVSFGGRSQVELIEATILPIEQESIGKIGDGGSANPALAASSKPAKRAAPAARARTLEPTTMAPAPTATKHSSDAEPKTLPIEASDRPSDGHIALASALANSASSHSGALVGSLGNSLKGSDTSGNASSGTGLGSSGTASGQGSENGVLATQARYRDTPRPQYPESARREGHEGRVLLRVLIDDQGRAKTVEINTSSGSQVLDRAAAEAIRRWRFHPARYGDQPVESWLRVPIEFRLADVKSW